MELTAVYPGLHLDRFLREIKDILSVSLENSSLSFSEFKVKELEKLLLSGKPFPYILNDSEFYHHHFYVNESVLIPRPETELLVDMIVRKGKRFEHVLDVGTGSGVLLLSLVKSGIAKKGTGSDVSPAALNVAKTNQRRLRLTDRTDFILSDRLLDVNGKFDLIISNPPYIKASAQRSLVHDSVDKHEPHIALYLLDAEYDQWFTTFFEQVKLHLSHGGEFWMEGHEQEVARQADILKKLSFSEVEMIKDYTGSERFLRASSPK